MNFCNMHEKQAGSADAVKLLVMQQGSRFLLGHGLCHYNRKSFRTSMTTPPKGDATEGLYVPTGRVSLLQSHPPPRSACSERRFHPTLPSSSLRLPQHLEILTGKAEVTINGNCAKINFTFSARVSNTCVPNE